MAALRNLMLAAAIAATLFSVQQASAFDLTGAWSTSAEQCKKIFARKGRANQVAFTNFSGVYGGGFIADANRLKGKSESCQIKSKKESDQKVNVDMPAMQRAFPALASGPVDAT